MFKKILVAFMFLAIITVSTPKAHAISLDDLFAEITSLKSQISELKTQLSAAVSNSLASKVKDPKTTARFEFSTIGGIKACREITESTDANGNSITTTSSPVNETYCGVYSVNPSSTLPVITSISSKTTQTTPAVSVSQTITSSAQSVTQSSTPTPTPTVSAPAITLSLTRGSDNIQVTTLQQVLASLGFFSGEYTTFFGAKTEAALKAFQTANGLEAVGSVGPRTRALLSEKAGGTGTTSPTAACNSNTQPWIRVVSPNGGETFTADSSDVIRIKWRSCNMNNVRLELRQHNLPPEQMGGYSFYVITSSSPNTGSFDFPLSNFSQLSPVAGTITPGNNFYIRASDSYDFDVFFDYSDQPFTINSQSTLPSLCNSSSQPSIRVISPNGGETYTAGQQITVKWSSCNIPANENVRIDLNVAPFPPLGVNGVSLANTPNDGVQLVTLPVASAFNGSPMSFGTNFKVNIWRSSTGTPSDLSDNLFTISAQQQACSLEITKINQASSLLLNGNNIEVFKFKVKNNSNSNGCIINSVAFNTQLVANTNATVSNIMFVDGAGVQYGQTISNVPLSAISNFTGINYTIPPLVEKTFSVKASFNGIVGPSDYFTTKMNAMVVRDAVTNIPLVGFTIPSQTQVMISQ